MPKIITAEEAARLGVQQLGRRHPVRVAIENMEKGTLLHITRQEFKWKLHTPSFFCNQLMKAGKKKFKVMKTRDKNGWVIERTA